MAGSDATIKRLSLAKKVVIAAGIAGGLSVLVLVIFIRGWLEVPGLKFYDLMFHLRGEIPARPDIVVVGIDSAFKMEFRENNAPVSRVHYAALLDALADAGAAVVAFDLMFEKPDWTADGDAAFAAAIARAWAKGTAVLLSAKWDPKEGVIAPIAALETDSGLINMQSDTDMVVRRMQYIMAQWDPADPEPDPKKKKKLLHGALCLWAIAYKESIPPDQWVAGDEDRGDRFAYRIGTKELASDFMRINFLGGAGHFIHISPGDILNKKADLAPVKGAIVLLGDVTPESQDLYPTPFARPSSRQIGEWQALGFDIGRTQVGKVRTFGVEVHAHAVQSLLDNAWIRELPRERALVVFAALAFVTGLLFFLPQIPVWVATIIFIVLAAGEAAAAQALFRHWYWLDMVPMLLVTVLNFGAGILYKNVILTSANRKVAGIFGQYVSPAIVEKLLAEGETISLKGKTQDLTVLFSDIRGFTTISERLTPAEIGTLLNVYFDRMIKVVFKHDGTLDKLMGDSVMAFFGDPVYYPEHPVHACRAALAMEEELKAMHANPSVPGLELVNIGIGLNSGVVTVGDLGSTEYRDYTVIGDNVNLGSRVEGQNKDYGTRILITEFTHAHVKDLFECRKVDAVRVKGKKKPVVLYELIAEKGKADPARLARCQKYEAALAQYMARDFTGAKAVFAALATEGDGPSKTFLERCDEYQAVPPPADWDGSYTATHK
ncbi:MAG: adenylate/guanylate cyclase domain-containing protein [Planctomycetota bacterium]